MYLTHWSFGKQFNSMLFSLGYRPVKEWRSPRITPITTRVISRFLLYIKDIAKDEIISVDRKHHRNGIKKPQVHKCESNKGVKSFSQSKFLEHVKFSKKRKPEVSTYKCLLLKCLKSSSCNLSMLDCHRMVVNVINVI